MIPRCNKPAYSIGCKALTPFRKAWFCIMKIAFISAANSSHTVKWVNALVRRGPEVRLYSLPDQTDQQGAIDSQVTVVYLKKGGFQGYFANKGQLRRELKAFAPDIVNAHFASGYGTLARCSKARPLLLSVWGSDVYDFPAISPLHRHIVTQNIRYANAVASTSHVMAQQVRRATGYDKHIYVTPFGVDCSRFCPAPVAHEGLRVGTVKLLEAKYGMEYLIQGFADFLQQYSGNATLSIYGKGSKKEELQAQINSLGMGASIKLMGAVPNNEVPEIINQLDLFVLPSVLDSESFGVSAVEAMACGVPVIASDVDGFRETVEDGVTGSIIKRRDSGAITQKLLELAENPAKREQLGKAGRERVLRLYDFDKNVDEMERIYHIVAGQ